MVGVEEEHWEYFIPKCATLARGLFSVQGNQDAPDIRKPFTSLLKEFRGYVPERELLPEIISDLKDLPLWQGTHVKIKQVLFLSSCELSSTP